MKQKLLSLLLLTFTIGFAKTNEVPPTGPAIGIMSQSSWPGNYQLSIKNTGTETLTNIYVTQSYGDNPINFQFSTISSLAPGQQITNLIANSNALCFDQSQVMVHATTVANVEITDLSSDSNNGGTYYNDGITYAYAYFIPSSSQQEGIYQDVNNNNIVDVADAINYTYTVNNIYNYASNVYIADNNATITSFITDWSSGQIIATGIHYITQAEINYGYVYNTSILTYQDYCNNNYTFSFSDESTCYNCPNPNNAKVITSLNASAPHRISGNVKFNNNNDNCATGINFTSRRVNTTDGTYNYATYTNNSGDYHLNIPGFVNNYSTSALTNLDTNFTSNPVSINTSTSYSTTPIDYNNNNFCISVITNTTDLSVMIYNTTPAIPGNSASYVIYFHNNGTTNLNGSIQLTYDNGKLVFTNASQTVNSSTANTLTWNYTNLLPFQWQYISLAFNVLTPPTVNAGDTLTFTINGNTTVTDDDPANNTFTLNQTVRSSFDPNDKTVMEGASITAAQTGKYLNYVTRFQNTGTANATTVVIKETLDPKLDWSTFEPIESSHTSNIQIKNGNELTYTFSDIGLAYEAADEFGSHGWMAYRIKPKSNVAIGDIMSSKSDIYFDYNLPITTNTATTEVVALSTAEFVKSNFKLYPNPAANYFVIEASTAVESTYRIIDINGKVLQSNTVENMKPIDISNLQAGFYFVSIKTNQGSATYKLIKS
jgi:uncharacterized repeat protein (TIGR01451 family)